MAEPYGERKQKKRKIVQLLDDSGAVVQSFNSGQDAAISLGIPPSQVSYCCNGKIERTSSGHRLQFEGSSSSSGRMSASSAAKLKGGNKQSPTSSPDPPFKSPARSSSPNLNKFKPRRLSRAEASDELGETSPKDMKGKRARTPAANYDADSWALTASSRSYEHASNTVEQGDKEITEIGGFVIMASKSEAIWRAAFEPTNSDQSDNVRARKGPDGKRATGVVASSASGFEDTQEMLEELAAQRAQAAAQKALITRLRAELRDAKRRLRAENSFDFSSASTHVGDPGSNEGNNNYNGSSGKAATSGSSNGRWRTPSKAALLLEVLGPGAVVVVETDKAPRRPHRVLGAEGTHLRIEELPMPTAPGFGDNASASKNASTGDSDDDANSSGSDTGGGNGGVGGVGKRRKQRASKNSDGLGGGSRGRRRWVDYRIVQPFDATDNFALAESHGLMTAHTSGGGGGGSNSMAGGGALGDAALYGTMQPKNAASTSPSSSKSVERTAQPSNRPDHEMMSAAELSPLWAAGSGRGAWACVAGTYNADAKAKTAQHTAHLDRLAAAPSLVQQQALTATTGPANDATSDGTGIPPDSDANFGTAASTEDDAAPGVVEHAPAAGLQLCKIASDSLRRLYRRLGPVVRGAGGRLLQIVLEPVLDSALKVTKRGIQLPEKATTRRQANGITGLWVDAAAVVVLSDEEVEAHWTERRRLIAVAAARSRKKKNGDSGGDEDGNNDGDDDEDDENDDENDEDEDEKENDEEREDGPNNGGDERNEEHGASEGGDEIVDEKYGEINEKIMKSEDEAILVAKDASPETEKDSGIGDGTEEDGPKESSVKKPEDNEADASNEATTGSTDCGNGNTVRGASVELEQSGTGVVERSASETSPSLPCPVCHQICKGKNGLSKHMNMRHAQTLVTTTLGNSMQHTHSNTNDKDASSGFNSENDEHDEFEDREEMTTSASGSPTATTAPDGSSSASRKLTPSGSSRFPFVQCLRRLVDLPGAVTWVAVQPVDVGNRQPGKSNSNSSGAAADAVPEPHLPAFVLPYTHTHPQMGALMEQAGFRTQKYESLRRQLSAYGFTALPGPVTRGPPAWMHPCGFGPDSGDRDHFVQPRDKPHKMRLQQNQALL